MTPRQRDILRAMIHELEILLVETDPETEPDAIRLAIEIEREACARECDMEVVSARHRGSRAEEQVAQYCAKHVRERGRS